jgi:hypothetical protein
MVRKPVEKDNPRPEFGHSAVAKNRGFCDNETFENGRISPPLEPE